MGYGACKTPAALLSFPLFGNMDVAVDPDYFVAGDRDIDPSLPPCQFRRGAIRKCEYPIGAGVELRWCRRNVLEVRRIEPEPCAHRRVGQLACLTFG